MQHLIPASALALILQSTPVTAPASEARVAELVAEYDAALASENAHELYTVLVRMAEHDNAEFAEAGKSGLFYQATRLDRKEVAVEAERLAIDDKDEIELILREREVMVQEAGAQLLGNIPGKESEKALAKALKDKEARGERPRLVAAVIDALGRLGHAKSEKEVVSLYRKSEDEVVVRASVRFFGQVKTRDLDTVLRLCRDLEPPPQPPSNIPNQPVTDYGKRQQRWYAVRDDVVWALEQITGRKFRAGTPKEPGDGKEAAEWVKENARELGLR